MFHEDLVKILPKIINYKGILNVGYDNQGYGNYEMPIATEVDLVEDIILVDAKVILGLFGMNVFQKCFLKYSVSFTNRLLIHGTSRRSFILLLSFRCQS